ncbi:MAG: hypothetical protein ACYSTT_14150 [Planctomycetota bacterium]|jgi:hypothetical protein
MKSLYIITRLLLLTLLSVLIGCEQPKPPLEIPLKTGNTDDDLSFYTRYVPEKIDIMPLTEFVVAGSTQQPRINIYVSLIDQFGSQVKSPGMFRFELYEYKQRSSEPKGKRAVIWPDVDLTDPVTNNDSWRDFLRAYEFSFPCEQAKSRDYILQVTCLCPNGKRLSSEFTLKHTK